MRYFVVDAFTDQPFGGNPAGVVLLEGKEYPDEGLMLNIAAELRYSETAFVRQDGEGEFTLRYFTPKAEVELCGHATIATFVLLHQKGMATGQCLCHTNAGDLVIQTGEKVMMQMARPRIEATLAEPETVYRALGVDGYRPAMPVQKVYAGLPDIIVPIADVATLQALQPDMEAVKEITRQHEAVSIHAFAFFAGETPAHPGIHALAGDSYTAHVRDFAPLYGVPEESATGTANAALTYYLQQCGHIGKEAECSFIQGEAMGRPSVVATRIQADGNLFVGGTAAIVAKGILMV